MRTSPWAVAVVGLLLVSPAFGDEPALHDGTPLPSLLQVLQSSAVPPIGRMGRGKAANILPGNFDNPNRTDAVVITSEGTKYCKGPHFKKCDAITDMPMKRTVAVKGADGRAILLRWDGATSFQTCSVDWSRGSASVDCRNLSYADLPKYGGRQVNGLLMIDGTDGQYMCQSISKEPSCHQVAADKVGTPPEKRAKGERAKFRPDRNTVCRFNGADFDCKPSMKLSEDEPTTTTAEARVPTMKPVIYYFEEDDDPPPPISLEGVEIFGQFGGGYNGGELGFWGWQWDMAVSNPAIETQQFTFCMNTCHSGYQGSLTTCLASYPVGFALGAGVCGVSCGEALGSLFVSTCMLGREIEYTNCKQGCIDALGT